MCFFFGFKVQIILRGQNNNWYIKGCRYNQGGKMVAQFAPCLRARLMSLIQWAYRLLILFQLLPPRLISRTRVYSFQISAGRSKDC